MASLTNGWDGEFGFYVTVGSICPLARTVVYICFPGECHFGEGWRAMSFAGSSGGSRQTNGRGSLPSISCPICGVGEVKQFTSSQPHSFGRRFFRCEHQGVCCYFFFCFRRVWFVSAFWVCYPCTICFAEFIRKHLFTALFGSGRRTMLGFFSSTPEAGGGLKMEQEELHRSKDQSTPWWQFAELI